MEADALTYEDTQVLSATCLCANVQRAARSIGRHFDEAFRPLDLTNWQFTLMVASNRPDSPTISALAVDLTTDRTTITANLKPFQRRALVTVAQDKRDRRVRRATLTPAGNNLLRDGYGIWKRVHAAVELSLGATDIERLHANLRAVIDV